MDLIMAIVRPFVKRVPGADQPVIISIRTLDTRVVVLAGDPAPSVSLVGVTRACEPAMIMR